MEDQQGCNACAKNKTPRWRKDFPIEWEADHYVARREMVKFFTLGSLLLVAANWAIALAARVMRRAPSAERYIASVADLDSAGGSLLFRYPTGSDPCILLRGDDGSLLAYSQVCTHLSCAVIHDKKANDLVCPCHNGHFAISDGRPTAGPPTRALPRVKLVQREGKIFAVGMES